MCPPKSVNQAETKLQEEKLMCSSECCCSRPKDTLFADDVHESSFKIEAPQGIHVWTRREERILYELGWAQVPWAEDLDEQRLPLYCTFPGF